MNGEMPPRGLTFEPLPDIPMDKSFTLEQLTGKFQSVRDGAPELPKNSKDHYSRLGVVEKIDRQIVVIVSPDMRRLGVLDFGGAKESDFEGWQKWSSGEAGRIEMGSDIEAGYGNGGKSFMVRGSVRESYMCGYSEGLLTKMGFQNDDPTSRYHPGWYKDDSGSFIKSLPARDPAVELNRELQPFGLTVADLPPESRRVFKERKAFTIVAVDGVKDWVNSRSRDAIVNRLPFELSNHPQMALTIETCMVWVMRGKQLLLAHPLKNNLPDPFPGFEEPKLFPVPDHLEDLSTHDSVSTGTGEKFLEVRTSRRPLRISEMRALNVIRVRNDRNVVANWPIAEIAPVATSTYLYGTLKMPALVGEHLAGAERQTVADTPLTRALRQWVERLIVEVALEIQRAQVSRDSPEDREAANDALQKLRELMRKYLRPTGGENGRPHEFGSIMHEIVLESGKNDLTIAVGTIVPIVFKCYEHDGDKRLPILRPRVHMVVDLVGIVKFNGISSVTALEPGTCKAHLENLEGTIRSNEITIKTVKVSGASLADLGRELKQGEIAQLDVRMESESGVVVEGAIYQIEVEEPDMGHVGRTGVFTAGGQEGFATVRLIYGPDGTPVASCSVAIGPDKVDRTPPTRTDIPLLLLCGTTAPGREELPEGQRTCAPGPQLPTIIDFDPLWEDVVWINLESAEARKIRGSRGPTGAIGILTRTVYQFLALKVFEVLRRLKVKQDYEDRQASSIEFLRVMSEAEIEAAPFLDKAYDIVVNLIEGIESNGS